MRTGFWSLRGERNASCSGPSISGFTRSSALGLLGVCRALKQRRRQIVAAVRCRRLLRGRGGRKTDSRARSQAQSRKH